MSFWICADRRPASPEFFYFTKEFDAPAGARLTANCSGDSRYALYINGHLAVEGPCQGSSYQTYYESEDLTKYLVEGKNKLEAKVLYVTDGYFISVFRGSHPGFWFDGKLEIGNDVIPLGTDHSWTCQEEQACAFSNMPGLHISIPPFEQWSGDSQRITVPVVERYQPCLLNKGFNQFGLGELYVLRERVIPQMETEPYRPMKEVRRGQGFAEYDAGVYTTAKIRMKFKARKGSKIRLIWAESYSVANEAGHRYKHVRDAYDHPTAQMDGAFDSLIATGEEQSFEPFWYRAYRFVRVEFEDPDFALLDFSYAFYHYPLDAAGVFSCSNERYNKMWEISRNTVLCCMHEMYVDCPYYEQQQYDMDSALEMLFTLRMSADDRMPFKSITDFAHSQMADGMLQANYPSTMVQIIPDFTLFWVLMLRDYLRYAGGTDAAIARVRSMSGTVDKALESFEPYMTKQGLVGVTPYWHFVDWVPGWEIGVPNGGREEPITVTSLMYAAALNAAAEMCDTTGRPGLAADYRQRAQSMIANVKKYCYDEEVGLYRNTPSTKEYSQHTTLWAILSGAVSGKEAGELIDRTFDGHVPVAICSFSMSYYMFRALELAGRYDQYAARQLQGWETMLDWHCTTWCENPDSPRSECHGWSSAPIYEFSSMVLGVYPTADGYGSVRVKPHVHSFDLTWAKGTVPTPKGIISVAWEKKDGELTLDVTLPEGCSMPCEVILPDGQVIAQTETASIYTCKI